jgi:hypothetical protein
MTDREGWKRTLAWLFAPERTGPGHLWPRWVFLRALGLVFLSAFYSLAYQIQGLIGPTGILPADTYLARLAEAVPGVARFWYAPTLLWLGAGHGALTALVVVGSAGGLRVIPVGRDAPRGGVPRRLLRAIRLLPAARRRQPAIARRDVSPPVGMVPHLLRIGSREARERRPVVARPDGDGSLLRERPAPDVARLVRAALGARVPGGDRGAHARRRARTRVVPLLPAPVPARVLRHRHDLADRDHPDCGFFCSTTNRS